MLFALGLPPGRGFGFARATSISPRTTSPPILHPIVLQWSDRSERALVIIKKKRKPYANTADPSFCPLGMSSPIPRCLTYTGPGGRRPPGKWPTSYRPPDSWRPLPAVGMRHRCFSHPWLTSRSGIWLRPDNVHFFQDHCHAPAPYPTSDGPAMV